MKQNSFGPHLTVDLIGSPIEILQDYQLHFDWLKKLPEMIGMTPITQPYVFPYAGLVPEDRGITGIAIIAESHLSIHSFELKSWSFIDIFSCKDFDVQSCLYWTIEWFKPQSYKWNIVERGVGFPRTVEVV